MLKPPTILSDGFQSGLQASISWLLDQLGQVWARIWINMVLELKGRANPNLWLSAQGSVIHGALGRALLAGGAALQPDERAAQPLRGQNVLQAQRPSTASTAHAPAGRDQTPLCDQVGNTRLFASFSSSLLRSILICFRRRQERKSQRRCVEIEGKVVIS